MPDKNLSFRIGAEDDASKVFQKLARTAKTEMGKVDDSLDDTRTAGKRAADALSATFDALDAEMTETKAAADRLAQALGPELAGKIDTSKAVTEFRNMGLSIEAIEADADSLAAALKKADDVNLKHFSSEADTAAGSVDRLRNNSDQSRSVLANMVGNTTQDLGQLGGVAGSAGVAIGQLGEYAADGNIALGNLAKIAGPMALVTAAGIGIAAAFKTVAETKAFNRERVKGFTDALEDGVVAAEELQDVLASGDDDNSLMARIGRKTIDVEENVRRVTGSFDAFNDIVAGGAAGFNEWATEQLRLAAAAGASEAELENLADAMQSALEGSKLTGFAVRAQADGYKDVVFTAYAAGAAIRQQGDAAAESASDNEFYGETLEESATAQERSADAASAYREELGRVTAAADAYRESVQANIDLLNEQIDAQRSAADATIAVSEAQEDFSAAALESAAIQADATKTIEEKNEAVDAERDAMIQAADAALALADQEAKASGRTATATEKIDTFNQSLFANARYATPAAQQAIYDYIIQANEIPEEKATAIRATVAAGDLPEAERLINEASRTRNTAIVADAHTAQAERDLNYTARTRAALINAQLASSAARAAAGTADDPNRPSRAAGGPVRAGVPVLVGEKGPEVIVPAANGTVIPNHQLTGATGRPAGNVTIVNHFPAAVSPAQVQRALRVYERRNGT